MKVIDTRLPGVLVLEPQVHGDARGFFLESWNQPRYQHAGITDQFMQCNLSRSRKGVLRGLHFQQPNPQGKLVWVLEGEVYDVAVDIRPDSPNYGRWAAVTLTADNFRQFYVPEGYAHGFCVLSDSALFAYLCTRVYEPDFDRVLRWDDPAIAIDWPTATPELSAKDQAAPNLEMLEEAGVLPSVKT